MNISTRITEYSITGGLLWVNVFLFVTLLELSEGSINLNAASKVWATWIAAMAPLKATLEMALPVGPRDYDISSSTDGYGRDNPDTAHGSIKHLKGLDWRRERDSNPRYGV